VRFLLFRWGNGRAALRADPARISSEVVTARTAPSLGHPPHATHPLGHAEEIPPKGSHKDASYGENQKPSEVESPDADTDKEGGPEQQQDSRESYVVGMLTIRIGCRNLPPAQPKDEHLDREPNLDSKKDPDPHGRRLLAMQSSTVSPLPFVRANPNSCIIKEQIGKKGS
jgi:hypothetical protein